MPEIINLKHLPFEKQWELKMGRWKARTDLGWLCRNILDFKHVTDNNSYPCPLEDGPDGPIHQPIIDVLQKFPVPSPEQFDRNDRIINGRWEYEPVTPLIQLPGKRRVLILDPRGFLKTTINVVAHTIQWIINYPDITIMIVQSNGDKAVDFLKKIKLHFQGNDKFRRLFPEHCPTNKVMDWGRADRFTTEARSLNNMRAEPTVMATSIDKGAAGYHVDVMKFSDIVDPSNISGNGIQLVKDSFYVMQNLLVGPQYWIDVEGTRYKNNDLYGEIIDHEEKVGREKGPDKRMYAIHARPVFEQQDDPPNSPENLAKPFRLDEAGKRISRWPRRFSTTYLEDMEVRDPATFATQQLNNPSAAISGGRPFPVENGEFDRRVISRKNFKENVPIAYKEISVDCAYTIGHRSDYTAIVVGAFDHYGRCYVEEIDHGRYLPDEVNARIVAMILKHEYKLKCVKIENSAFTHGMMPGLKRLLDLRNRYANFVLIPRETDKSKEDRILKTLQPWYKSTDLRFLDDIAANAVAALRKELNDFPTGTHDDILDAISDLFQDKEWFGREVPKLDTAEERQHYYQMRTKAVMEAAFARMVGETPKADMFSDWDEPGAGSAPNGAGTGIL